MNFQQKLLELRNKREQFTEKQLEKVEQLKERIGTRSAENKERVATRQAQARKKVVERIKSVFGKILKRYTAALQRLDKIADRIASRIDKLKAKGVNTAKAEAGLTEAEKLGAQAKVAIDDAQAKIAAIDPASTTVKDAVHQSVDAVKAAKKALFSYHKGLVAAIRELKAVANLKEATNEAD